MIQAGKNITSAADKLHKIEMSYLYHAVNNPRQEILQQISQLRRVLTLNSLRYRELKKKLPYVVAGAFSPPYRKKENFAYIDHVILDIDHLSDKDLTTEVLKSKLKNDPSVELMFVSPGNDGLKIFFSLEEKLYDHGKFSLFYKVFARYFAKKFSIDQVVDNVTSDVTRACFFSYDPEAYYNPECERVKVASLIDFEDYFQVREAKKMEKEIDKTEEKTETPEDPIDDEKLIEIKKKLGVRVRTTPLKNIFVPEEVEAMVEKVKSMVSEHGIEPDEVSNINYGKKFRFHMDMKKAEINLFYGKNGFRVVKSPKKGTYPELNDVVFSILCSYFYGMEE